MIHKPTQLTQRWFAAAAVIDEHTILVYGGKYNDAGSSTNDGFTFDTRSKSIKRVLGGDNDYKFDCA